MADFTGINSLPVGSFALRNSVSPSVIANSVRTGITTNACSSSTACCSASSEVKNGITEVPSSFSQCCRSSALSSTICSPSAAARYPDGGFQQRTEKCRTVAWLGRRLFQQGF
jgi:hypothetical protein